MPGYELRKLDEITLLSIHLKLIQDSFGYSRITERQWELMGKAALLIAEAKGYDVSAYLEKNPGKEP